MKKIFVLIITVILIIIGIYLSIFPKQKKIDKKHYICNRDVIENINIKLENLYEFYYVNNKVTNYKKQFKVTYKDKTEYDEALYNQYFETNDPVNKIEEDNENMTRTYIWEMGLQQDKNDKSIEKYLIDVEKIGYKCEEIK